MIKKNIKPLNIERIIQTYEWRKGSEGIVRLISNYYKENYEVINEERWQDSQGEWNIDIKFVAGGFGVVEADKSLLMYVAHKIETKWVTSF
jgi:hypothetical protein